MISSCCRDASSVLRANSSAMAEIWRLDNPDRTERESLFQRERRHVLETQQRAEALIQSELSLDMHTKRNIEMERLTEFFHTVIYKLLLLFLICFSL